MLKRLAFVLFLFASLLPYSYFAEPSKPSNLTLYYFWGNGCQHCAAAESFVEGLHLRYPNLEIMKFEVWSFPENSKIFENFSKAHGLSNPGTPSFFIGGHAIVGWDSEQGRGKALESIIEQCSSPEANCPDSWELSASGQKPVSNSVSDKDLVITVPFFGTLDLRDSPLLFLSLALGFLDGFNPCAMWVLVYLISMLAMEKNRKKMWLIAGVFLATTAIFYYLILTAWLNVFLFLGYLEITRILIGIMAVAAGCYGIYKHYFTKSADTCEVVNPSGRKKLIDRMRDLVGANITPAVLLGVAFLAVTVNMIEFVCSAGFPALFTRVLAENTLSFLEYQFYVLAYLFMFMIDDILIFTISVLTLSAYKETGEKYAKLSHIVGSALMLLLGLLLLLFPKALVF